jgi:hypothetical protein
VFVSVCPVRNSLIINVENLTPSIPFKVTYNKAMDVNPSSKIAIQVIVSSRSLCTPSTNYVAVHNYLFTDKLPVKYD